MLNMLLLISAPTACALATGLAARAARQRRARAIREAETRRQEMLLQEMLLHRQAVQAVTGGRLRLCGPDELRAMLTGRRLWSLPLLDGADVGLFRQQLREVAARRGLTDGRLDDLCSCVSEAAGNAIRHSQGGVAQVWADDDGFSVLVTDCGRGIPDGLLLGQFGETPEARDLSGDWSGLGFRLMLATSDTLALSTGPDGTQLLLKVRTER